MEFDVSDIISSFALLSSLSALYITWRLFSKQRDFEKRRLTIQLHDQWWSAEIDRKRHIVWSELEQWERLGDESASILNYSKKGERWSLQSDQLRAHARIFYFFCDINVMIKNGLIDVDLAFELFGIHHYQSFRPYFLAIRKAIRERKKLPDERMPRFVRVRTH